MPDNSQPMVLAGGKHLGNYQVLAPLGAGGMGEVYRARDLRLNRIVALKVLPKQVAADPERKRRFIREAQAASALNHPNIITIYEIGEVDGIDFIAMEFVEGKTLDQLAGGRKLSLGSALKCAIQACDALATAHAAGIVHRDLKPGNVMVREDGLVKVLDFGLAKLTERATGNEAGATETASGPHTEEGAIVGTVSYMSPEQAQGLKVDARSDIFSFGALLYEMITGRRAFSGQTKLSVLTAILHKEPAPVSELAEAIPRELERVISRCLRKDPHRRFQGMGDLRVALEEVKEESESGVEPPVREARRPSAWNRWWVAAVAAVVVAAGLLFWLWARPSRGPEVPLTAAPITSYPGQELYPTFSPDGTQVAFSWDGEQQNNFDIWIKAIGPGKPLRLTTTPLKEFSPAWSPDGRLIAFLRQISVEKVALVIVPALGGAERQLAEVYAPPVPHVIRGPYLAWTPDGKWLAIANRVSLGEGCALFLLSLETLEQRRLTTPPPGGLGDLGPAFSPDGHRLVFVRTTGPVSGELYLLSVSPDHTPLGEPQRLTFQNGWAMSPVWTPNGREIIFSSGDASTRGLWRIGAPRWGSSAPQPERIAAVGEDSYVVAISRSAQGRPSLAYTREVADSNIWGIERSAAGKAGAPTKVVSSTRKDRFPHLSPNGEKLVYVSDRTGASEIWVSDNDGANPVQLTSMGAPMTIYPRWSPDGAKIAFTSSSEGQTDIHVISAGGGPPNRLIAHPASDVAPSWSRDGRWIYFFSTRSDSVQVWKAPAGGGEAIQVTRGGGYVAVESPDSRFLYYCKSDQAPTTLWRVPVEGGEEVQILDSLSSMGNFDVADDGIYFIPGRGPEPRHAIRFLEFATGKITTVAALENRPDLGLAVSRDGRWIRWAQTDQQNSDLMLVENFR